MRLFKKPSLKKEQTLSSSLEKHGWPDHVVNLDENTFDDFIKGYPYAVVDFWASWCGPCKAMGPRLRRVSKLYQGTVAFGKLDVQKYKKTADRYHVRGIPHLVFFHNGKVVSSVTGVRSIGDLKQAVEAMIGFS